MSNNIKDILQESVGEIAFNELDDNIQHRLIKDFNINSDKDNALFLLKNGRIVILEGIKETEQRLDTNFNIDENGERKVFTFERVVEIYDSPISQLVASVISVM